MSKNIDFSINFMKLITISLSGGHKYGRIFVIRLLVHSQKKRQFYCGIMFYVNCHKDISNKLKCILTAFQKFKTFLISEWSKM